MPSSAFLLVPVGSTEQHGPHLPFDVDTVIAAAVCIRAAAAAQRELLVAPAITYGASGEHQDFPGTVSIGTDALTAMLVELGRSARTWARALIFVNGHGGNVDALHRAVTVLREEGGRVSWIPCRHGAGHAGRAETSIMLHLDAHRVAGDGPPGIVDDMRTLMPRLRKEGVRKVAPNGILGDPAGATAAEGDRLLARMTQDVLNELARHDT